MKNDPPPRTLPRGKTVLFTAKFVAFHYLALGVLATLAYVFGRRLTRGIGYKTRLEETCFSVSLGLGVIAYLTLFLSLLGFLYRPVLLALLAAGCILCAPVWLKWVDWVRQLPAARSRLWSTVRGQPATTWLLILVLAVLAIPILLLPLYPPIQYDAAGYHLPYAKTYVAEHRMVLTPYLRFPVSPQSNQMLFTLALLLSDDILAHLIELLMMVTVAASVLAFGRRFLSQRAGWWSAAIFMASPVVLYVGTCGLIDMGVTLFSTMAGYALWIFREQKMSRWLVLSGVFCGLAVGTKLTALFVALFLGLAVLFLAIRERRPRWPVTFGGVALLVALPWLARSFYYTGNPIYPLIHGTIGRFFRTPLWRPEYYVKYFDDLGYHFNPQSFSELLRLPWRLSFETPIKYSLPCFFPLFFLLLPLLVLYGVRDGRIRLLLAYTIGFLLFWFFTIQDVRYLVLVLPALSLASAESLHRSLRWLSGQRRWFEAPLVTIIGLGLLAMLGSVYAARRIGAEGRFPVTVEQREDYLTRMLPTYPAFQLLNRDRGRDYTLYAFFNPHMAYYADGVFIGDYTGEWSYSQLLAGGWKKPQLVDGAELFRRLRALGVNYFLIDRQIISPGLPSEVGLPRDKFFADHFKPILARAGYTLFELSEQPLHPSRGAELLANPGFEMLQQSMPEGWTPSDHPVVDASGRESHSGLVAVKAEGTSNILSQKVTVPSPGMYSLSFCARTPRVGQMTHLWVDWEDSQHRVIASDMKDVDLTPEWDVHEMFVSKPSSAVSATIYVIGQGPGTVWFDDFSFAELEYR